MFWSRIVFMLVALWTLGWAGGGGFDAWAGEQVALEKPKGEKCLEPTEWMRRNHMDYLKDKRELTVRQGVRYGNESFLACQECHVSRDKFCDKCHGYVGVAPDCFECHIYP